MTQYPALDRLAASQQNVVSLNQCRMLGLTERQIESAIGTGTMIRVRPTVYRWCGAKPSWRMMSMAAVLAAGERAVLSHRSAGAVWGLVSEHEVSVLEITDSKQRRLCGVTAHRHALYTDEQTKRWGIPVTTIERTLLDLAELCTEAEIGRLIDEALRRRLTTTALLTAALDRHAGPGRRRIRTMRLALADRGGDYDPGSNDWEKRMDQLWDEWCLPAAKRQHKVRLKHRAYVIDRAIVDLKIGVEWNGRGAHGSRSAFDYDSDRRADLIQAGWMMLDFTSNTRPERIIKTVLAACDERQRLLLLSA